jgi:hypothetical protein
MYGVYIRCWLTRYMITQVENTTLCRLLFTGAAHCNLNRLPSHTHTQTNKRTHTHTKTQTSAHDQSPASFSPPASDSAQLPDGLDAPVSLLLHLAHAPACVCACASVCVCMYVYSCFLVRICVCLCVVCATMCYAFFYCVFA